MALFNDSLLLRFKSGFSWISLVLACCAFTVIWFFQLSLVSRFSPRYLTDWLCGVHGIGWLFIWSGVGVENVLNENILADDFVGLSLIFHLTDQSSILFRCFWISLQIKSFEQLDMKMAVSSANWAMWVCDVMGMSAVYILKRVGDSGEPWGNPAVIPRGWMCVCQLWLKMFYLGGSY